LVTVKKSGLFSLGADATVYVWGRPALIRIGRSCVSPM